MGEPAPPYAAGGREASGGTVAALLRLTASLGSHLEALARLAGAESREAATHFLWLGALLAAAILCALFGYFLAVVFLAFLLATLFAVSWLWIVLGFAVLHLGAAAVLVWLAKSRFRTSVFAATGAEIRKDFAALKQMPS